MTEQVILKLMKRKMIILRNTLLHIYWMTMFLFSSPIANAQDSSAENFLWGNTKVGMKVDEVKHLYPHSVVRDPPAEIYNSDMKEILVIEDFDIASIPITIRFLFLNEDLHVVILRVDSESVKIKEEFYGTSLSILSDLLMAKYGTPFVGAEDSNVEFRTHKLEQKWKSNGLNVSLSGLFLGRFGQS